MLKKTLMRLMAIVLILMLVACGSGDRYEEVDDNRYEDEEVEVDLGEFLEENRENLIATIATEGEEVQIELDDEMNNFIFTIIIDSIELTDENRILYSFAFDASFVHMEELFVGLAEEIRDAIQRSYFAIRVIFADVSGEAISSQIFSTSIPELSELEIELEIEAEGVD